MCNMNIIFMKQILSFYNHGRRFSIYFYLPTLAKIPVLMPYLDTNRTSSTWFL
jgi:hypothetical protein